MSKALALHYEIGHPGDRSAGMLPWADTVTIMFDSGETGYEEAEVVEYFRSVLKDFTDGGYALTLAEARKRDAV